MMVSKERFKVVVPFDARAIEIFKGMGTRLYGKTAVSSWAHPPGKKCYQIQYF